VNKKSYHESDVKLVGEALNLREDLDDDAKRYFLQKVSTGEIDTLPEDPKAEYMRLKLKGEIDENSNMNENVNPELHRLVNAFVKKLAGRYDYSLQDAVNATMEVLRSQNYDGLNENIEDNGAEEKSFDAELMAAANGIAATLGKELKAKQGDKEQLDEAVVTSIIAAVLTGNALIGFISKITAKLMKKLNLKKGEDFAKKINKWAHDNEKAFQAPIKRVLKFFIKDPTKLENTTQAIYAVIIMSMAVGYGTEAVSSLSNASWFKAGVASLKGIAKGDEAIMNAYPAIKAFLA
jgi:hypothetical protein